MTCEEDLCSENGEDQRKSLIIAAKGGQTEISVPWVRLDARLASGRLLSREMVQGVCRRLARGAYDRGELHFQGFELARKLDRWEQSQAPVPL